MKIHMNRAKAEQRKNAEEDDQRDKKREGGACYEPEQGCRLDSFDTNLPRIVIVCSSG